MARGPRFGKLRTTREKAHGHRAKAGGMGGLPSDAGGKTVGIHVRHMKKPKAPPKPKAAKKTTATATSTTTAKAKTRKGRSESAATRAKISASLRARRSKGEDT
jgi:hypothetical protein